MKKAYILSLALIGLFCVAGPISVRAYDCDTGFWSNPLSSAVTLCKCEDGKCIKKVGIGTQDECKWHSQCATPGTTPGTTPGDGSGTVNIPNPLGSNSFEELLTTIAAKVGELIAYLGVIMIIVAGILYLTSGGSTERMSKAKTALIYAIAGIAIGLAAQAIVAIIKNVLGVK